MTIARFFTVSTQLALMLTLALLTACGGSEPTTFYMLDSQMQSPTEELSATSTKKMPKVVLQEVSVPAYLDRTAIVTRPSTGVSVNISEFNSWSEDLNDGVQRVLSDVLMNTLLKENVKLLSLDDDGADARKIFVFIQRLDGALGGQALLDARWTVHTYDNRELVSGTFVETLPAGMDYTSLVKTQSSLIVKLAESMSTPIGQALQRKR